MKNAALPVPGILFGAYPERRAAAVARVAGPRRSPSPFAALPGVPASGQYRRFIASVRAIQSRTLPTAKADAPRRVHELRSAFSRHGLTEALMAEAFALIAEASARLLGKAPYDTQLMAARVILDNRLAEMATGEGKTLAAGIAAATAALAGIPVHVITANDYLAARDAQALQPVFHALGLTVGNILPAMNSDTRRRNYDCDLVYCTAKELAFDYLRDGLGRQRHRSELERRAAELATGNAPGTRKTLLRGLCMAIVDEADSILIDDARVPLVISEPSRNPQSAQYLAGALELAASLILETEFTLDRPGMTATLTTQGRARIEEACVSNGTAWRNRLHREETVCQALAALHLYERDRNYLVREDGIVIIDEATGRAAPGRVWSRGLHQLIEVKEGREPTGETATAAQITYQRFFQRYLALGGMSGTLREARAELASVYGLRIIEIPTHRPCRREVLPTRLFGDRAAQMRAVVSEVATLSHSGRPVLIGTDSVAASQELSRLLAGAGVAHKVLDASQDREEAQVVALAGQRGRVTVATNMAGRGTDIALGEGVAQLGGLHVISCQLNASARIDRQLAGRCA
ncbi:MAG TPA: DEAD/DEAH box helicase, partial [Burkholderiales bacterium]|nr:DEAD/DEAH box helicase [Burkholderiales bacterium]